MQNFGRSCPNGLVPAFKDCSDRSPVLSFWECRVTGVQTLNLRHSQVVAFIGIGIKARWVEEQKTVLRVKSWLCPHVHTLVYTWILRILNLHLAFQSHFLLRNLNYHELGHGGALCRRKLTSLDLWVKEKPYENGMWDCSCTLLLGPLNIKNGSENNSHLA